MFPQLFHWLFHDAAIWVRETAQLHPYWCFPIGFAIAFSESFVGVSFIVPGTFLLITMGGVIGASHIPLWPAWAGAVAGSILGDWISWWIGFHYHHKIVHFRLFRRYETHIEKGLHFFHRWGTWAIFIGRFITGVKAVIPGVAGMMGMSYRHFSVINVISAFAWAAAHILPGVLLTGWLKSIGLSLELVIIVGALVLTVLFVLLHFWKSILLAVAPFLGAFGRTLVARFGKTEAGH